MPTVSEFWDGRAQDYDAQVGTHYAEAYEKTAACFKKYLKPTDTVLDFACGTGIVTFAVAPSVQSVRAIDVSGEMVRRAQEKVKAQGVENVTVTQTDLFDGCLAEGSFNAVLACNVLLYIEDRSAALARIRALLNRFLSFSAVCCHLRSFSISGSDRSSSDVSISGQDACGVSAASRLSFVSS